MVKCNSSLSIVAAFNEDYLLDAAGYSHGQNHFTMCLLNNYARAARHPPQASLKMAKAYIATDCLLTNILYHNEL